MPMEVITIESKAFKEIASKLDAIYEHVSNSRPLLYAFSDSKFGSIHRRFLIC